MLSDTCNIEALNNINSEQKIQFNLENFIKQNSNTTNKFILAENTLEFNILKDPASISINSTTSDKYLIYNSNKNNILLVGTVDVSGTKSDKAFIITVLKNIYLVNDASGVIDPNFTVNSYVINNINGPQFIFNSQTNGTSSDGKLKINTVDNSGNNVNIVKPEESQGPDSISGPNTIFNIDDNGFNIFNTVTLSKKQLISYDELQKTLRPCYTTNYKDNTKQIIGLIIYFLQNYKN